jgi:hypothetical protein
MQTKYTVAILGAVAIGVAVMVGSLFWGKPPAAAKPATKNGV